MKNKLLLLKEKLGERLFIIFLSIVVGSIAGLSAILLKTTIHFIQYFLTKESYEENYYQFLYPIIGLILTTALAKRLYKESVGHAISDILYSISKRSAFLSKNKMYSRMVTSAATVGFGGSVGLESPMVLTGSAIGTNIAKYMNLNYRTRALMMGCGTAGVISAIFNSPIAGMIFSIEVILTNVSISNFTPLLLSSITATLLSISILGSDNLFSFNLSEPFLTRHIFYYLLLGMACGLISIFFTKILTFTEDIFTKIKNNYLKACIGGLCLTVMIFIAPAIYGEGYLVIKGFLNNDTSQIWQRFNHILNFENSWAYIFYLGLVLILKIIASCTTISAGGSGGVFAPSLFIGGTLGFIIATILNLFDIDVSVVNFTLVGMCGVMSGIQYAPLTAIFLIAEITGGYVLFLPLMLVSAMAYLTVSYINPHSMYLRDLIKRGDFSQDDPDKKILINLSIDRALETDLKTIDYEAKLKDLVKSIASSKRNIFPVLDKDKTLLGIITLDDVRELMFDKTKQDSLPVKMLMRKPLAIIDIHESMSSVMNKFEISDAWNLPVVENKKYRGMVSKSRIFSLYRTQLKEY